MELIFRFFAPFFLIVLASCGPKVANEMTNMHDEVMVIHDDVMPKMKDIHQLKKKLRKLKKSDENPAILSAITELEKADDAMMDWMANYDKPKEDNAEAIAYLTKEMEKIATVRDEMLAAIDNAKSLVNE